MKNVLLLACVLLLSSCAQMQLSQIYTQEDFRIRFDSQKEKVFAYLSDKRVLELSKASTDYSVYFDQQQFDALCRSEDTFLLVHSHVGKLYSNAFPSPHYEKDGKIIGDFGTIFSLEYHCERIAVYKGFERADIVHGLYDVTNDMLVLYDIGDSIKERISAQVSKDAEQLSLILRYGTVFPQLLASIDDVQAYADSKQAELLEELNIVYEKARNIYFGKRCEKPSGEVLSGNCTNISIGGFAEEIRHLGDYFTITPCKKGEMCL